MWLPRFALITVALPALLLAGCTAAPSPPAFGIDLGEISTVEKEVEQEVILQDNCGGTAQVANEIVRERVVSRELTTASKFEVSANGEIKILGTGVGLGAAVAAEVGVAYGTSESMARSVTVAAAPGVKMQHQIAHREIWKVGVATVTVGDGQTVEVPFEFRKDFSLELVGSKRLLCPQDQIATPTAIPQLLPTDTPAPPTATTTSTPTPEPPTATATAAPTATPSATPTAIPAPPKSIAIDIFTMEPPTVTATATLTPEPPAATPTVSTSTPLARTDTAEAVPTALPTKAKPLPEIKISNAGATRLIHFGLPPTKE